MQHHKLGRNDPCHCGSGKKYKKCCEEKDLHRKINAQMLTPDQEKKGLVGKVQQVSSLFKRIPAPQTAEKPEEPKNPVM